MQFIEKQLKALKTELENAIINDGAKGKESIIRSSNLINRIHDAVKYELIEAGINEKNIFPPLNASKPEIKLAGFLKQKDQDICVIPSNISKRSIMIDWGPLAFQEKRDLFGFDFSTNTMVINVRSQLSSIAKNTDTLFERTFAEAQNLHMRYPQMVLGEVYLIPVYEYDDNLVKLHQVGFHSHPTDIEKYISFFDAINNRPNYGEAYAYERCALLIVDFNHSVPRLFHNSRELKKAGIVSPDFSIEYANLSFDHFAQDLLDIYASRFPLNNIMKL